MPTPISLKNGVFRCSGSDLAAFCECPRKYYYSRILRRETIECKVGRTYGSIIHKALASERSIVPDLLEREFAATAIPMEDYRNLNYAQGQLTAYYKKYPEEPFTIATLKDGMPAREVVFALPLTILPFNGQDIPVLWCGTIDAVIRWPNGQIEHLDYKTTSIGGTGYFDEYYNNVSQLGYCWALNEMGYPSTGFLMDVLVGRKPSATGKAYEFMRQRFDVDKAQLADWKSNVISIIGKMFHAFSTEFDYHRNACKAKFGKCDYFALDTYAPDVRPVIINEDGFKTVEEYSTYAE